MGFLSDAFNAISGAIPGVGPVLGGVEDAEFARRSQERQAQIHEAQYKHRYQWQMEDMRRAGLNPILSYKQGAPGVPGVGGISSDFSGSAARGVSSAVSAKLADANVKQIHANVDNIHADTALKGAQAEASRQAALFSHSAANLNQIEAFLRSPAVHGTAGLMEILRGGGDVAELFTALNRGRLLLGLGRGG